MGVAGSGKTTVGRRLARTLGWRFFEGDDFHPAANVAKMRAGHALTDADRKPWLAALRAEMQSLTDQRRHAVFTCSALKNAYRDAIRVPDSKLIYLRVDPATARTRLASRTGHYFDSALLPSQYAILEEPEDALVISATQSPSAIVREVMHLLDLERGDEEVEQA